MTLAITCYNKLLGLHVAGGHFLWQDLSTGIKVFVLVVLAISGIDHYRGHLFFTKTSGLVSPI